MAVGKVSFVDNAMKYILTNFCTLVCITVLLVACASDEEVRDRLYVAESHAVTCPDSTLAILDGMDRDNLPDDECRRIYDLAWVEGFYIRTRTVTDSLHDVLSRMETRASTRHDLIKRILQSIHRYNRGKVNEALFGFEDCRRESAVDIPLYWKAVVEDYLGIICLTNGLSEQSQGHFYKVLEYARLMDDKNAISNAYSHLSFYYRNINQLDSALYYASCVMANCDPKNTKMLSVAYNNMASIQMALATEDYSGIVNMLRLSDSLKTDADKSMNTYSMLSRLYYLLDKQDSAYMYQIEVERGSQVYAKYNLHKFLYKYYLQANNTDSAYKYLKLYTRIDSILLTDNSAETILNTIHQYDLQEAEQESTRKQVWVILISILLVLSMSIGVFFRYKAQIAGIYGRLQKTINEHKQAIADARMEWHSAMEELDTVRGQLQNTRSELQEHKDVLSNVTQKAKRYQQKIDQKNTRLAHANRMLEKNEKTLKLQSAMVVQGLLDKSVSLESVAITKSQIEYLVSSYAESSAGRKAFVQTLRDYAPKQPPTGLLICILYNEGFSDKEIMAKLQSTPKNFASNKYRARMAIAGNGSTFICHLLRKFDANKG